MTGVFQNALLGFQTGNQYGEQRRRRNALSGAGEMGAGGDWTGAQNALLKGGYLDEANAYGQFGEQARTRQTREAVTTAVQGAGNDPMAGLRAGAGAALQGGDTDQFARLTDMANKMDDNQRARASEMQREQANLFAQLSTQNLPPEQAKARVLEALQSVPGMDPQTIQRVQQKGLEEFTPQMMRQNGMRFMEAADVFARQDARQERQEDIQYRDGRDRVEDRRWNQMYGARYGGGGGGQPAQPRTNIWGGPAQGEQFDATNPTGVKASAEQRGRIALSFENIISSNNQLEAWEREAAARDEEEGKKSRGNTPYGRDWLARAAEAVPFDGGTAARALGGDDYQSYETAARSFEQSILPAFAGSAVTESEAARFVRANQPRMGDSASTLAQKADNRRRIINAAAGMIGQPAPFPDTSVWEPAEQTGPNTQRIIDSGYMTPRRDQPTRRERTDQIAQGGLVRPRGDAPPPRPRGVPPSARWDAASGEWVE